MKCNACWTELEPKTQSVASTCGHLFCVKCAQSIVESDGACPVCEALITKNTVKLVTILQEPSDCRLHLCGQTPEAALNSALAAVNFYMRQQELHYQMRESHFKKKLQKVQEQCKQRLAEVHNGYQMAKRKYQEAVEQKHQLERDNEELQQKYAQKAAQTRKLQEMVKTSGTNPRRQRASGGSRQSNNRTFPPHPIPNDPFKARSSPSPVRGLGEDLQLDENLMSQHEPNQRPSTGRHTRDRSGSRHGHHSKPYGGVSRPRHTHGSRDGGRESLREILGHSNFAPPPQSKTSFLSKLGSPDGMASF